MISVPRRAPSAETADKLRSLTEEFATSGLEMRPYWTRARRRLTRPAEELSDAFSNKCGYCESIPTVTSYANIDHFVAKSLRPELAFEWTNWIYACPRCNTTKGKVATSILCPTADPVEDSISFIGPRILGIDELGAATVAALGLENPDLESARDQQLSLLCSVAKLLAEGTVRPPDSDSLQRFVVACLAPDAPYAGTSRCHFGEKVDKLMSYRSIQREAGEILLRLVARPS
jgi:hypothetical protein